MVHLKTLNFERTTVRPRMIARDLVHNAVVARELRTRMRGWRASIILTLYLAVLGAVTIVFLAQQAGPSAAQSPQIGAQLFRALALFQLLLLLVVAPASTAGAIGGERRQRTWDLLLATPMSSFGIVVGTLLVGVAFNLLLLVAALPLLSLVVLFGGVGAASIAHTYLVLVATALMLGAVGVLISAISSSPVVAIIVSNVIALLLSGGLTLLVLYGENWNIARISAGASVSSSALNPLAQLDPVVALAAALPGDAGSSYLGGVAATTHVLGLPIVVPLWEAYCMVAAALSVVFFLDAVALVRRQRV